MFARKAAARVPVTLPLRSHPAGGAEPGQAPAPGLDPIPPLLDSQKEAERLLLARYAPPSVVINRDFDILQFRGDTGPYLAPAQGRASLNLLKMLREGLLVAVRGAVHRAQREHVTVREDGLRARAESGYRDVNLVVMPIGTAEAGALLVLFEQPPLSAELRARQADAAARAAAATPAPVESAEQEILRLKQELAANRDYLQAVIEQQEAANEELQSANEEVQSANEELQSINEELETSKEEIQSSNEELATVNDELQNRNLELSESNNDLINLLASVQMAIVMVGADLRIRRFTPAAEKLLNLIPTDLGRPVGDIKLNIEVPEFEALLTEVIDSMAAHEREVQDRRGRWFSLRVRPYRTLENRIDGAVVMLIDVDSLKRAEQTLRESERSKDEFLSMLSHELRNPLAALRSAAEILDHDAASAADRERALAVLQRQTRNMVRMVDDLLDLSRISHGRMQLQLESTDVAAAIRHAVAATEHERQPQGQRLELELPEAPVLVQADPMRLEQALVNLLGNASRFTPAGGRIWVTLESEAPAAAIAAGEAVVRLRDDGQGFPAADLGQVSEPFTQHGGLAPAHDGLGVGLALAQRLVHLHGGSIETSSGGRERGSQLQVRLPLAFTLAARQPAADPELPAVPPCRVLLVEDNADAAELCAVLLRGQGHSVRVVHRGLQAHAAAREFCPDAVLLDLALPDLDGYEVARQLRADPTLARVALIAVSGLGSERERQRARAAGIEEHLLKPASGAALQAALARVVAPRPGRHAPSA